MARVPLGFRALSLSVAQLSLPAVLKCGQSFRWQSYSLALGAGEPSDAREWRLALEDRVVCLRQSPDTLFYRSLFTEDGDGPAMETSERELREDATLLWIRDYFQLDIDLERLYDDWSARDPVFKAAAGRFGGIRILRQDPWENLVSFICSTNNHISRITSMVENLCIHFTSAIVSHPPPSASTPAPDDESLIAYHPFPTPRALSHPSTEATLRNLGFGYRAKYIQKTAALLCETHDDPCKWLMGLRNIDKEAARLELLKLHGIGPKVADCILLMSLNQPAVVPVDTHVYQIAVKHYGFRGTSGKPSSMTPKMYAQIAEKLASVWGSYAGWAHCVLFTADLKAFSSYGLPSPAPTVLATASTDSAVPTSLIKPLTNTRKRKLMSLPTPESTPTPFTPGRAKRAKATRTASATQVPVLSDTVVTREESKGGASDGGGSLIDAVKLRRRKSSK
ncbi:hypothetical protein BOTBODRAFT_29239 [Botryobasidium botryosum FD-172 SS1]|uniref:DNA-(apurinic or apyrimidinic site) lyase n=1 Tax=Botryobasidium botryosum (strain FD-172 SS1) TaxID=930990 RepID=A0A067N1B6_BOTB1|nr:hypothetical protein BOTBODRAFT_29239 [Botryobasidium botryosum FD-172 SS1]